MTLKNKKRTALEDLIAEVEWSMLFDDRFSSVKSVTIDHSKSINSFIAHLVDGRNILLTFEEVK